LHAILDLRVISSSTVRIDDTAMHSSVTSARAGERTLLLTALAALLLLAPLVALHGSKGAGMVQRLALCVQPAAQSAPEQIPLPPLPPLLPEHREAGSASEPPSCQVDVEKDSPFLKQCTLLRDVCVDQVGGGQGGMGAQAGARAALPSGGSAPAAQARSLRICSFALCIA